MPITSKTVRAIFEEALELEDAAQRQAFLEQACRGVEPLRREVEELLKAHESAGRFLNHPEPAEPADGLGIGAKDGLGTRIGRYKLLRKLGEGGWGVVYLAEQNEPVKREVALKVIRLGMDTRKVIARFEAERQALAMMEHPNIAQVFDAGATETGRPFFVMEVVRGTRITEYCDEHRLSTAQRLELFRTVCEAIQHAHQKGIIHRDIKPSNILITLPEGSSSRGCAKVIDFGIAKATEERLTDKTALTELQTFIGTPAYISPEQAVLGSGDIDTRSDIYSLGVVLYELLTGNTPFDSETLLKSGLEEMRRTLREKEPVRPSTRTKSLAENELTTIAARRSTDPPGLVHELRGDLDWIVMKCLDKDRSRRYQTASELAADLDRYLQHRPITARPPHPLYLLQKTVRRHRLAFTAAGALALMLVSAVVVSSWQVLRASRAERRERNLRQQSDINLRKAEDAREEARAHAYAGDMKAADTALSGGNLGQARDLIGKYVPRMGERDLRGLEWRYLWLASRGDEVRSFTHPSMVGCTAFSADGKLLATACFDNTVRIWNAASGKLLRTFSQMQPPNTRGFVEFSRDGLFAAGSAFAITIRKPGSWQILKELPGRCQAAGFSPDGTRLAGLAGPGVRLWDTKSWRTNFLPMAFPALRSARLAFTSDGHRLAVASATDRRIEFWDLDSQSRIYQLTDLEPPISMAVSPDGRWLAAGAGNGELSLWSLTTGQAAGSARLHNSGLSALAFSPDSQALASAGGDQLIHLLDFSTNAPSLKNKRATLKGHLNEIWSLAYSRDGQWLVSGSKDATAKLWNSEPGTNRNRSWRIPEDGRFLGQLGPNGQATILRAQGRVEYWDTDQNRLTQSVSLPPDTFLKNKSGAEFVLVRQTNMFFATTNGTIESWTLPEGRPAKLVSIGRGPVSLLGVSPDHKVMLIQRDAQAVIWDLVANKAMVTLTNGTVTQEGGWFRSWRAAFSPDSRLLAYSSTNFTVKLWDIANSKELFTLAGHTWGIYCLLFSPDGTRLASSSWDGSVRLWNPQTGKETVFSLKGHLRGIHNISFSPDSRTLVTSGDDDSIRCWSVATGSEMIRIPDVRALEGQILSDDGNTLVWTKRGDDKELHLTRLPTLAEIDAAVK